VNKTLQRLAIGLVSASLWPVYMFLLSSIARIGPWPRSVGRPMGFVLVVLGLTIFASSIFRWLFRKDGWLQQSFELPPDVLRQLHRAKFALVIVGTALLLPEELLSRGLLTSAGRSISVPTVCHLLIVGFELMVWIGLGRLIRPSGPLGRWLATEPEQIGWAGRHRRSIRIFLLAALGGIIVLEARGYGFTARRVAMAGVQSMVLIGVCWAIHRLAVTLIAKHAWRWVRREANLAAKANAESIGPPADLPSRVRHLCDWGVPILGGVIGIWVWDVDLALFNFLGEQTLWPISDHSAVTVANLVASILIFVLTAGAWRYLSTIFALLIYPRMPEDPGIRFAVLTLCRYLVLAVGVLAGLSSIHLGLDKIGVVLAALGVGLGFGLQEIVSNFVSGIILLLERPIRVGDVVTVGTLTGKIDRINIRATTLINAENQSLIIPNREFITGNLVNWTHKDKIIRFSIHVNAALGTDPDRVSGLLLEIAKGDSDVLGNPVPSAYLDAFGASFLSFVLHVYVPEPSYQGKVRHRLCTQIQKQFADAGIEIPLPMHELRVDPTSFDQASRSELNVVGIRVDQAEKVPPDPLAEVTSGPALRSRSGSSQA
jgi:small-conductance mechanosensitive channel